MKQFSVRIGRQAATLVSPGSVALALIDGMGENEIRTAFTDMLDLLDVAASDPLPARSEFVNLLAQEIDAFAVGEMAWAGDDCVERIQ